MIDLHSHLLPGIDDGASSLAEALALAQMAVDDGISHITLTPHIHTGRFDNDISTISPVFSAFRKAIEQAGLPLTLAIAGEVRISDELLLHIPQKKVPFLGEWRGKKVLLLELPHSHIPPGSEKLVKWLLNQGIVPMIAHPERNKDILRNFDLINPFVEMGCLFQLTAMSVSGNFGRQSEQRSVQMLEKGWVTILATDAHNIKHRPPVLSEGFEAAKKIIGEESARALVVDNPRVIAGL